jgi:hypothetical protein
MLATTNSPSAPLSCPDTLSGATFHASVIWPLGLLAFFGRVPSGRIWLIGRRSAVLLLLTGLHKRRIQGKPAWRILKAL